jgi:hypothetical protein
VGTEVWGVRLSSRAADRPIWYALGLLLVYMAAWRRHLPQDLAWAQALPDRRAPMIAGAAALGSTAVAAVWGIHTASGADAYGYVSQADLWLRGQLVITQPPLSALTGIRDFAFTPLGYRPGLTPGTMVPIYAPGLPLLMALAKAIGGACGPYAVVPICTGVLVWSTYRLGALVSSRPVGVAAALLTAFSPVVLFQSMWPMSDVPVAAAWALAMAWLARRGRSRLVAAGLATGAVVLIRPNLVPLVLVGAATIALDAWGRGEPFRATCRALATYSAAALPGILFIAWLNDYLYGSPLSSGYTHLGALFRLENAPVNAYRYAIRFLQTHTPLILFSIVPLVYRVLTPRDRTEGATRILLYGTVAVMALSYLFYGRYEEWWYLRFLLPAFPPLLVAMCAALGLVLNRVMPAAAAGVATIAVVVLAITQLTFATDVGLLNMWLVEARYQAMGRYLAERTPPNAAVITVQHSGSARYYGGRLTVRYDWFNRLDQTVAALRHAGYRPYLLLEDWERLDFNRRFTEAERAPALNRNPIAEVRGRLRVALYDLDAPADDRLPDVIVPGARSCEPSARAIPSTEAPRHGGGTTND